jgi:predicted secreted protein
MSLVQALVVFAVMWFLTFFVVLPLRFVSQDDDGAVVPGTPRSAPAHDVVGRKARITTAIALVLTVILYVVINSGVIRLTDIDFFNRGADSAPDGTGG